MKSQLLVAALLCLVVCSALTADTITPTYTEIDGTVTGLPTAVNLITQGQPTFGSLSQTNFTPWTGGSSDVSALNDNSLNAFALSLPNSSWTLNVALNTSASALGYDITDIKTISGWNADYVDQNYQLSYSTFAHPNVFIPLGTYALNNGFSDNPGGHQVTLQIDLAGALGGVIASHVANLQFQFSAANSASHWQNSTAYREIEVFGTASTPEPSSLILCGLGALGLLVAARRHKA